MIHCDRNKPERLGHICCPSPSSGMSVRKTSYAFISFWLTTIYLVHINMLSLILNKVCLREVSFKTWFMKLACSTSPIKMNHNLKGSEIASNVWECFWPPCGHAGEKERIRTQRLHDKPQFIVTSGHICIMASPILKRHLSSRPRQRGSPETRKSGSWTGDRLYLSSVWKGLSLSNWLFQPH